MDPCHEVATHFSPGVERSGTLGPIPKMERVLKGRQRGDGVAAVNGGGTSSARWYPDYKDSLRRSMFPVDRVSAPVHSLRQVEKQDAKNQIDGQKLHALKPIRLAIAVDLKN
jgi:hypothetical protein